MPYQHTRLPTVLLAGPLIVLASLPAGVHAQAIKARPLVDARIRYEHVDQEGLPQRADALTVRVRPGVELSRSRLSAILEAEMTGRIAGRFNDGLNQRIGYPLIPDADNIEINRAQLRYAAPGFAVTAGRQLLELADQRFVGSANFRQNQQTFDAARLQWTPAPRLSIDLSYAWSVRTPAGRKGQGARPRSIDGNNIFALVSYAAPIGTLTGFAYRVDQDAMAVQNFRLQNQSYGLRLAGQRPLGAGRSIGYIASYARQSGAHRNPNRFTAAYWLTEATLSIPHLGATLGYEVLGADDGRPFTSFQTPDDSAFRFQGWAGRFITTPPDGVRDLYATLSPSVKRSGALNLISGGVTYHRFRSDRQVRSYGDEWDAVASAKLHRTTVSARYAMYRADGFATDLRRFWLSTEWAL